MTRIADPHSLALHEALMIEGGWDQYSDKELASYLSSSSFTSARLRDQLASGELVLLKEIPAAPVFRLASGRIVPTESTSAAIAENAVTAFEKRFGDRQAFPSRGTAYAHSDSLPPPPKLDYTPEPPVIEPPSEPLPPPVVISENFGLPPLGPKVFAKSCTRPSGNTDSNEGQEKASNFGTLAMLAPATVTSPGANGLRPLGLISGSAMRLAKGWAMAARIGASVMSTAASTVLLALWPSKLGDSTLYTEEELLEMAEAAIRVRFHLHVDATGNLRVAGYHVNDSTGYKDRVPVAHAELKGENFEVVVDDDFTLVWYPDDSGHRPVVSTEYPADSGIDPYSILVTPIQEDGQEHSPPGYQRPFEDQVELIVSFPADSGIEPLYLVFQKRAGGGDGIFQNDNASVPKLKFDYSNGVKVWETPAGLKYGPDPSPKFGNRLQHVLNHASDLPTRPGKHGVFDSRNAALQLTEDAWEKVRSGDPSVTHTLNPARGSALARDVYLVPMNKRTGYVGGQWGNANGLPEATHIRLVIENGSNVISSFPVLP